jgi:hypothetical protein
MPGLGRIYQPDDRDRQYPMRALMATAPAPLPASRLWTPGPILDQGQTPRCVGYGCRDWLSADPNRDRRKTPAPSSIYRSAQKLDGIPGRHDGSTVRAGLQVLQALERVSSYHWAQSIEDVRDYVLGHGCVILGVSWYAGMFEPDSTGLITLSGALEGGHCILCIGADTHARRYTLQQSWGPTWGRGGLCDISEDDLARLLSEDGEAAAALEHGA